MTRSLSTLIAATVLLLPAAALARPISTSDGSLSIARTSGRKASTPVRKSSSSSKAKSSRTSRRGDSSKPAASKKDSGVASSVDSAPATKPASQHVVTPEDCDLNHDGTVAVDDILAFLPLMHDGCSATPCEGDVNVDGVIDVKDLMAMLANFGMDASGNVHQIAQTALTGGTLVLQDRYASDLNAVHDAGLSNNAVCVASYALSVTNCSAPGGIDDMLAITAEQVKSQLVYYANFNNIAMDTDGIVVLDIEGYRVSPVRWGNYLDPECSYYDPARLDAILDAYALRVQVAREVFPNAKLGLWDSITPHPFGNPNIDTMQRRMRGYERAAQRGLYDLIDYACPVVYLMWGSSDSFHNRLDDITRLGIEGTRSLKRTDGSQIPMMPMLSLTVFNGDSAHDREHASLADVSRQVDVLRSLGCGEYMIWNGNDYLCAVENRQDSDTLVVDRLSDLVDYMDSGVVAN